MKLQERIEQIARKKHTEYLQGKHDSVIHAMQSLAIAILTDPAVGFKEALEALSFEPQDCETDNCVHEWAGKQLKELKELSK